MKYTQEQAGGLVRDWTMLRERLRKRLRGLDAAIDLDTGVRQLDSRLKKRIAKLAREGYEPGKVNDKYPEVEALLELVGELKKEGRGREAAYVSRTIRDIRLLRSLAIRMSGRRVREPLRVKVDGRRVAGRCWACGSEGRRGEAVWWDRDRGAIWHVACHGEPLPESGEATS